MVPIQLAGMGGGVNSPELVAAVASAGGLGMLASSYRPLQDQCDALSKLGVDVFGVNFLVPFINESDVEFASGRARLVEFFWGAPDAQRVARVHEGDALAGWQVGSADEARAALDAGCDLIVAQGLEAGGHVRATLPLMTVLTAVLDVVDGHAVVVASGGIGSARAMAAALAAGADAVRVGTRFVAARESNAHALYRDALVRAGVDNTILTTAYGQDTGWPDAPHRVLRAGFDTASSLEPGPVAELDRGDLSGLVPIERFATLPPTSDCHGSISAMAHYAGLSVADVTKVMSAAEIIGELADGAEALLRAAAPHAPNS